MASVQKRVGKDGGVSYRVQVRVKGFAPESATFEKRSDALAWAAKIQSDMKVGRHFGGAKRHTFGELVVEYLPQAKDKVRLEYWRGVFGSDTLDTITAVRITKAKDKLLGEETHRFATPASGDVESDAKRPRAMRSGPTVNRYLAALSSCLSYAKNDLQWIERNPVEQIKKPSENRGRVRFLTDDERNRLLEVCRRNPDLYLAVVLSLTTGARHGEIMSLRYQQVDFKRKLLTLYETKNGERRALPLVGEAYQLLQERSRVRAINDDRIFPPTIRAKKAEHIDLRSAWESALQEADIKDFHWHDLRHTAASYLAMSNVSLVEIAKVLGHKTLAMVARYAHLSDGHIVATGEKLASRLGIGG